MITQSAKLRAIELNLECCSEIHEKFLWCATRDADDVVAHRATVALTNHWNKHTQQQDDLEYFPMRDLGLLFQICELAVSYQWMQAGIASVQHLVDQICAHLHLPAAKLSIFEYNDI